MLMCFLITLQSNNNQMPFQNPIIISLFVLFYCYSLQRRDIENDNEATYYHYRDSFLEVLDEIEV